MTKKIPFVDLRAQYDQVADEVEVAVLDILRSGDYIAGEQSRLFEADFARYCRVKHAIGVGNGTDAIVVALRALDIGPGDEVVTVSNTFIATAEAISLCGATPRLVDCESDTGNLDPTVLEASINEKTKAVIAVHLYGRPANMDAINAVAERYQLPVLEDAAQAQGARYKGRLVGSLGTVACFSFYPSKNLGAAGDAGAIVTNDDELADRMRVIAQHGCRVKYAHERLGTNSRLDSIQAAVLRAKLPRLDEWNARRRALASEYHRLFGEVESLRLPAKDDDSYQSIHHLFAVRFEERDALQEALSKRGVAAGIHYPVGVHRQPAFVGACEHGALPHTEDWADNELSLPMYETMSLEQVRDVCTAIKECFESVVTR